MQEETFSDILVKIGLEDIPPVRVPESLTQKLKEFGHSKKRFLVLWGPTGTFKTTAVKRFLYNYAKSRMLKNGRTGAYDGMFVRFANFPKVWQDQENEEYLHNTKLLIIDDLVFSGFPESVWLKLFELIDYRYTKPCKTIITTNHDLKHFLSGEINFYQRIASRLCDENLSMEVLSEVSFRNPSKKPPSKW
jgi:DNA replication protein DnaC